MIFLTVQLTLYGLAWLVIGLSFQLKPKVALYWGGGWLLIAGGAGMTFSGLELMAAYRPTLINIQLMVGFILLHRGVEVYTRAVPDKSAFLFPIICFLSLEILRPQGDATETLRIWLFTLGVMWTMICTAWRMTVWMRSQLQARWLMIVGIITPICLAITIFFARALKVTFTPGYKALAFGKQGDFDLIAGLAFLFVLGAINLSLASLVLGSLIKKLNEMSTTDQLTGIHNRREIMRRVGEEQARLQRSGQSYSVIIMDLDHFKQVNDTYGHIVGDQTLKGLAGTLNACKRSSDTLARYGGEEFLLLMPGTNVDGALVQARRICERVAMTQIPTSAGNLQITISLGVADSLQNEVSGESLIDRADAALYLAKLNGRNRVEVDESKLRPQS